MPASMTATNIINRAFLLATGKVGTLSAGDTKYTKLLALANHFQQEWANESGVDWESLRSVFSLGAVTATDSFALPATVGKLSSQEGDYVRITTAAQEYRYTIVPSTRLYSGEQKLSHFDNNLCAVVGSNLVFAHVFAATDPQFGGTITVPGYAIPADLVNTTDVTVVDNPNWLVQICAAEYDRTDITRVQYYPGLKDMADKTMASMKEQNDSQRETVNTDLWRPGAPVDYPWR